MNPFGVIYNYTAVSAIPKHRIVAWSVIEDRVVLAASATDRLMGISGVVGVTAAGDRLDVYRSEFASVEFGGAVSQGDPLTATADGKAVAAAPAPGARVRCIGFAEVNGIAGDIGEVLINPFVFPGV